MKEINTFYDINQFPQEEGVLFWGISMNRIGNRQSASRTFEDLEWIATKIGKTEGIGMVTWYSDYLYFHSDEPAKVLRDRYKDLMIQHKQRLLNTLSQDNAWIRKAFSFLTTGQLILDNSSEFSTALAKILELYRQDEKFQECIAFDAKNDSHGLGENEVMFILEEITLMHLAAKGRLNFNNRFISGTEKWVLQVYPGKPLKSEVYLSQKNPLGLSNSGNRFEDAYYDVEGRKLYEYSRIDLDTFSFLK